MPRNALMLLALFVAGLIQPLPLRAETDSEEPQIELRAALVPERMSNRPRDIAMRKTIDAFQKKFPHVKPLPTTGLKIPGRDTRDVTLLMQIAGDIPPAVIYVNFRQSDTFIQNKFLYPLDEYVEELAGVEIPNGHLLSTEEYLAKLKTGPNYDRLIADRAPDQIWPVIRRKCPYKENCPYIDDASEEHYHIWCFPVAPDFIALFYRKDMFYEAGLPDRVPATFEEMLEWARKMTNPKEDQYGLQIATATDSVGWSTLSFLYSMGGRVVETDEEGRWRCVFDTEEAVDAYWWVARFFLEPFDNRYGHIDEGVVYLGEARQAGQQESAMQFNYILQDQFGQGVIDPAQWGFGPVPKGPTGERGAEFNAMMLGIYAGLEDNDPKRQAAWEYIKFVAGPEAIKIRAQTLVEAGMGQYLRPKILELAGYPEYIPQIPKGWEEAAQEALRHGVPEPYGRNCQMVYRYVGQAISQMRNDSVVREAMQEHYEALNASDDEARLRAERKAKDRIREILVSGVARANAKMLNRLPEDERRKRAWVALGVAVLILLAFSFVFWWVFRTFSQMQLADTAKRRGNWQFFRFRWAYMIMLPALLSIALWRYWPLIRGTVIAFQDYNVRGFSEWVGMDNFARVLYDDEFWFSMWVAVKYALMFMVFGFAAPIVLAFLLTEVPRGKILFRTIYYLPAVLTGVVVIFLWKSFYGRYGVINEFLNFFVGILNTLPGVAIDEFRRNWLEQPKLALFFCLLPTIWAGMGPGCLIYLAALKTIPDDLYEAADIDGAGIWSKVFHVAIPGIRALIAINFIGAMIGAMQNGGGLILAMTGGGPYTPQGQTELVGLKIFWEAFAFLRFGSAAAMAWILGSMLIGFTIVRLRRLSRMEFRTARGVDE